MSRQYHLHLIKFQADTQLLGLGISKEDWINQIEPGSRASNDFR